MLKFLEFYSLRFREKRENTLTLLGHLTFVEPHVGNSYVLRLRGVVFYADRQIRVFDISSLRFNFDKQHKKEKVYLYRINLK